MFNVLGEPMAEQIVRKCPEIFITPEAYFTMQQYALQCPLEISWFSRVISPSDNKYVIMDAMLIDQTVSPASAEFSEEELSTFMMNTISEKGIDFFNEIKCWGHSHVNMSTSPSGQDLRQIRSFSEQDYYIMLIINKRGEAHVEFYDFKHNTIYKNIRIQLYLQNSDDIAAAVKSDIERCVKDARLAAKCKYDYGYGYYEQMKMFANQSKKEMPKQSIEANIEPDIDPALEDEFFDTIDVIISIVQDSLPQKEISEIKPAIYNMMRSRKIGLPFKLPGAVQKEIAFMLYDIYEKLNENEIEYLLSLEIEDYE